MKPGDDDLATSTDKLSLTATTRTRKTQPSARTAPRPNTRASNALVALVRRHVEHQKLLQAASTHPLVADFFAPSMFSDKPLSALEPSEPASLLAALRACALNRLLPARSARQRPRRRPYHLS